VAEQIIAGLMRWGTIGYAVVVFFFLLTLFVTFSGWAFVCWLHTSIKYRSLHHVIETKKHRG
jgi:hypothetical protein